MNRPVNLIAHFAGGPVEGQTELLDSSEPMRRVLPRPGKLRRALRKAPRAANYKLERSWSEDGEHHLLYRFVGTSRA